LSLEAAGLVVAGRQELVAVDVEHLAPAHRVAAKAHLFPVRQTSAPAASAVRWSAMRSLAMVNCT